jgi:uncharacterized protein YgbK (DUF1537 family)
VTPMHEADVAKHIALQSNKLDTRCLTVEHISAGTALPTTPAKPDRIEAVTLDCMDDASESAAGRLIWEGHQANPFVVGSQGVEYALVRHWQDTGQIAQCSTPQGIGRADRMVVVSGSVSATTADQIAWAKANGFADIEFDATRVCSEPDDLEREITRCVAACMDAISHGLDPLVHTAIGPDDPAVGAFNDAVAASRQDISVANQLVGEALGRLLHKILTSSGVRRAVVSGGDTSGHATRQLGIFALSALAPTIPGAALFKAHANGPMNGLELALKGGQMGSPDYYGWVRDGGGAR